KMGADSPENLLAYEDFDATPSTGQIKTWSAHLQDYNSEDQTYTWQGGKGKELIGAINYLSDDEGMNTFSFLTYSIHGDTKNVFPWVCANDPECDNSNSVWDRYDVSKLAQWEKIFEHADRKGMFLHFKTQETENDNLLDDGELGTIRKLYYRELIARFGHHLALNWNLGEEISIPNDNLQDFSDYIKSLDPYDHHIVVHTYPRLDDYQQYYGNMLGWPTFDGTSIQLQGYNLNVNMSSGYETLIQEWIERSEDEGRKWIVSVDEEGGAGEGVPCDADPADNQTNLRRYVIWPLLLEGGTGLESYFGGSGNCSSDLNAQDFRTRDEWWDKLRYARTFMEELPLTEMQRCEVTASGTTG